jgi:hypothetical protein
VCLTCVQSRALDLTVPGDQRERDQAAGSAPLVEDLAVRLDLVHEVDRLRAHAAALCICAVRTTAN